ncbi:MAG: hypothetical protein DMG81_04975 [Acidobacteria bacterium]|nr:MAG: hypothetical protein DMG81_04975 [Acidobacteriota bacterium]
MRIYKFFYLLVAVLIAQVALAKMPFTNEVFGKMEGTLDYCARVDSTAADKYQQKKKDVFKSVPQNEVDEARRTEEYKAGYDWASEELPKMPKTEVSSACAASLEEQK